MNLTCANCGSKLSFTTGKLNFAVEPCEECCGEPEEELIGKLDEEKIEKVRRKGGKENGRRK